MSTTARIVAFVVGLGVLFGIAFGAGRLFDDEPRAYTLTAAYEPEAGPDDEFLRLEIRDPDGDEVTDYVTRHQKELHLIALRKDFGGYRHLHPTWNSSDGWVMPDPGLDPGEWRLYADFQPEGGEPTVAYDDVRVPGEWTRVPSPPVTSSVVVGGYQVAAEQAEDNLAFTVSRDGKPVTDLESYLGAFGHLVVIRESDLSFLHVHPDDGPAGPRVSFAVSGTEPGRYRAYFEFQHTGVVRTAGFTLELGSSDEHGGDHGNH